MSLDTNIAMRSKPNVCVIGSANVDLIFRASRFPNPGETLTGHSFTQCMGGKGANQAVAAARLGAQVTFIACVGRDSFGDVAIAQYQLEGIDTRCVRKVNDQPTGTAAIVVDDQAENCIIVVPGANAKLDRSDVRQAAKIIAGADVVVCQLETPLPATLEAFEIARSAGKTTLLTPAPAADLPDELLRLCDVCVPNRTEIEMLVGCPVRSHAEAHIAVSRLLDRGVGSVALTLGSDGAFIADRNSSCHVPAVKVQAVDTTGAGDAFSAALAVSLSAGHTFEQSARRASLVAAISVTRAGTQPSYPYRTELMHGQF